MRILLDECIPVRFARDIPGHEVATVARMGWAGVKNGELLRLAASGFEVFVTVDQGIEHQQSLPGTLALVIFATPSNRIDFLRELMPELLKVLETIHSGTVIRIPSV